MYSDYELLKIEMNRQRALVRKLVRDERTRVDSENKRPHFRRVRMGRHKYGYNG